MRIEPVDNTIQFKQAERRYKRAVNTITRILALIVAFLSTFTFILKIVFF